MPNTRIEQEVAAAVLRLVEREGAATLAVDEVVAEVEEGLDLHHERLLRVFGVSIEHVISQLIAPLADLGFVAWEPATREISISTAGLAALAADIPAGQHFFRSVHRERIAAVAAR